MAGLILLVQFGCGDAPTPDSVSEDGTTERSSGPQTVTFHVPEMSDRLKLL
jgi:hypothetical protein